MAALPGPAEARRLRPGNPRRPGTDTVLVAAATLFTVAVLVHNADHLRRGGAAVSPDVFWIGTLAILNEVGVVLLVFMRDPRAPLAALVSGVVLAAGYLAVHFTPQRRWLSDSFLATDVSAVSVLAGVLETAAALLLAVGGLVVMGRRSIGPTAATVGAARALRSPVMAAMTAGNLVILVGLLLTR